MKRNAKAPQEIQAIFHRATLFTREEAAAWCEANYFKTDDYRAGLADDDETVENHIHAQFDPLDGVDDTWAFMSDDFPQGVTASVCQRKGKTMKITYTKGVQSADDPLNFIMSEESKDRMGDVIVAKGWQLADFNKNPIALWGHDHKTPIGTWENVKVVGKQLIGRLKLAAQGTSAEIDTIRSLVEQRILKSVSVGFAPIEYDEIKDADGNWTGFRFTKQALHETSLVSVPAHQNALQIAKSHGLSKDQFEKLLQGLDNKGQSSAPVGSSSPEGTAARPDARTKSILNPKRGTGMKTIAERILEKQNRLVQIKDRLVEIKNIAEADDAELSADEEEELTILAEETESVERSVEALQKIESGLATKAVPAAKTPMPRAKGAEAKTGTDNLLIKAATAKLIGHVKNIHPMQVIANDYGDDDQVKAVAEFVSKTAVDSATTTESGWAAELVRDDLQGFLTDLQPISVYAGLRAKGVGLVFDGANSVTIPRRAAGGPESPNNDVGGSWVGEGGVIPVKRIMLGSQTLNRYKSAVISTFTQEIMEQSTPAIEAIVRQSILDDTSIALDGALMDASAIVAGIRPAGLMNGVTPTASAGDTAADIITDLKVLFAAMSSSNLGASPALVMHPNRVLGLSTVTIASGEFLFRDEVSQGRLLGVPLVVSANVPEDEVMIVDTSSFASANDAPTFNVSDQATLTMANADGTAPTQADDGAGELGTAEQVPPGAGIDVHMAANTANAGYVAQSMFQTYSHALRMVLPTTWGLIRPGAVAALSGVSW